MSSQTAIAAAPGVAEASAESQAPAAELLGIKVPHSPFLNDKRTERIKAGRYEGQEIQGALHVVTPEDRVIEMGAGLGIVGAVVTRNARPAALMAFEANPRLIPHIEALYTLNRIKSKITLRNEVLLTAPDAPASVTFYLRPSFLGSSLIYNDQRQNDPVEVPTASFEAIRQSFRPTVLIMDIEGGEADFLAHADLTGIRAIVIEFHPNVYGRPVMQQLKKKLRDAGFARIDSHSTRTVWACTRELADG